MVYIEGNNCENCSVRVTREGENNESWQNSLNLETKSAQVSEQGPLSQRYMEPSVHVTHHSKLINAAGVLG